MTNNSINFIKGSNLDSSLTNSLINGTNGNNILNCFQCGKCTASCLVGEQFPLNPHQMTALGAMGASEVVIQEQVLKYCLTCGNCQQYCPQGVDFIEFIRTARTLMKKKGIAFEETHDGILSILASLQANRPEGLKTPANLVPEGCQVSKKGKVAYFIGCLPMLSDVFDNFETNSLKIAQDGIKILNHVLDKPPVIIENAKCCGHDSLWKGDFEIFKKLAKHNVNEIKKLGIETIVTSCAECFRTLKQDYPKYIEGANFNVKHLSELIADKIKNNGMKFPEMSEVRVTYHDPCRLGRHMKVYESPREILNQFKENGLTFNEMERTRENASCCGVSCFINCNDLAKAIQLDRLTEAKSVADTLVTTCPKCQIHFKCILHEKKEGDSDGLDLEITDLTNIIAKMMGLSGK